MMYKVIGWCGDCCGEDFQGCFDGSSELIGEYPTLEEAEARGRKFAENGVWRFEIQTVPSTVPESAKLP